MHILLEESFSETNSNYTEQQMASKVEVNRQSILNDGEKENLSINVLVAVLVGILTAGNTMYLFRIKIKFIFKIFITNYSAYIRKLYTFLLIE